MGSIWPSAKLKPIIHNGNDLEESGTNRRGGNARRAQWRFHVIRGTPRAGSQVPTAFFGTNPCASSKLTLDERNALLASTQDRSQADRRTLGINTRASTWFFLLHVGLGNRLALFHVQRQSGQVDVACVRDPEAGVGGDLAVLEGDALHGAIRQAVDGAGRPGVARHVDDFDMAEGGQGVWRRSRGLGGRRAILPLHIHIDRLPDPVYGEVAIGDVLHHSAAAGRRFEADGRRVARVHHAVLNHDVADAAGGLAAHVDAGPAIAEVRVLNQDVFRRTVDAQAVGVLARLDGDAIVVGVDRDVIDMHVPGGVDVHAVGAGDIVLGGDLDAVDLNVLAVEDEEAPHRLVTQVHSADEHVFGVLDGDQAGAAASWAGRRCSRGRRLRRGEYRGRCLSGSGRWWWAIGVVLQPVFARSIDRPFSGDDEAGDIEGVDEGRGPHLLGALPARLHLRVVVGVGGALQHGVLFQQQVHALLQEDGAAQKCALGDHEDAAFAAGGTLVDGRLYGLGVQCFAVAHRAKVGDDIAHGAARGVGVARGGCGGYLRRGHGCG